jgi:hypothetical protein
VYPTFTQPDVGIGGRTSSLPVAHRPGMSSQRGDARPGRIGRRWGRPRIQARGPACCCRPKRPCSSSPRSPMSMTAMTFVTPSVPPGRCSQPARRPAGHCRTPPGVSRPADSKPGSQVWVVRQIRDGQGHRLNKDVDGSVTLMSVGRSYRGAHWRVALADNLCHAGPWLRMKAGSGICNVLMSRSGIW